METRARAWVALPVFGSLGRVLGGLCRWGRPRLSIHVTEVSCSDVSLTLGVSHGGLTGRERRAVPFSGLFLLDPQCVGPQTSK